MHRLLPRLVFLAAFLPLAAVAQVAVQPVSDQKALLAAANPKLAANKRVIYDFWREIIEAGHVERVEKYMTESYVQHDPNVPTGRQALVDYFRKYDFAEPKPVAPTVKAPLVAIVAEGDLVTMAFASDREDEKDGGKKYSTTWFEMFRIKGGKIVEHWDSAEMWHPEAK